MKPSERQHWLVKHYRWLSLLLLWKDGKSSAFESKFVKELPKRASTNILTHPFDGKQISFLRQIQLAGSPAFGLVGIKAKCSADGLYVLPFNIVLAKGNMTLGELVDNSIHVDLKGIDHLLEVLFE
jgi:hypothetical protein